MSISLHVLIYKMGIMELQHVKAILWYTLSRNILEHFDTTSLIYKF